MSFNVPDGARDISFLYSSLHVPSDNRLECLLNVSVYNGGVQDKTKLVELLMEALDEYRLHVNSLNPSVEYPADESVLVTWTVPGSDTYEF